MMRALSIVLLAIATFAMLGNEAHGEIADDIFLRNIIPEISCSTTAVIKNDDPAGFRYSEYQTKICENFQSKFIEANRKLADLPKKSSIDLEKFFQRWIEITGALCKEITIEEKLIPADYGCLFGIPPKEQPITRAMYEHYLKGMLPDSYTNGSWCTTAARQENDLQKIALFEKVIGDGNDSNTWSGLEKKLLIEGFHIESGTGEYYRALGTSVSSDGTEEGWFALPVPIFEVYFGQERGPQRGELCIDAYTSCVPQSKAKVQNGICVTWRGFGP